MTVKISQENGKAVVSVDGNEALKADAAGNVEVVGDLAVEGLVAATTNGLVLGSENNPEGGLSTNSAIGSLALNACTTGTLNSAIGRKSLENLTTGRSNTAVGNGAGLNCNGSFNTLVGVVSGSGVQGNKNTVLGNFTGNQNGLDITDSNNNIAIADGGGIVSFFKDSSDKVHLRTGNQNRLTVQPSGNVSIANDLEVNGTTIAALIARIEALEAGN